MRKWLVIDDLQVGAGLVATRDFETEGFAAVLLTFEAVGADSSALVIAPPMEAGKGTGSNLPGTPAAPTALARNAYASVGISCIVNTPLPPVLRVSLTANAAAGSLARVRIEGLLIQHPDASHLRG